MNLFKNLWRDTGPQYPNFGKLWQWVVVLGIIVAIFCGLMFSPK